MRAALEEVGAVAARASATLQWGTQSLRLPQRTPIGRRAARTEILDEVTARVAEKHSNT